MNGPANYARAEALLDNARTLRSQGEHPETVALVLGEAQIHATLALAAAIVHGQLSTAVRGDWNEVAR